MLKKLKRIFHNSCVFEESFVDFPGPMNILTWNLWSTSQLTCFLKSCRAGRETGGMGEASVRGMENQISDHTAAISATALKQEHSHAHSRVIQ